MLAVVSSLVRMLRESQRPAASASAFYVYPTLFPLSYLIQTVHIGMVVPVKCPPPPLPPLPVSRGRGPPPPPPPPPGKGKGPPPPPPPPPPPRKGAGCVVAVKTRPIHWKKVLKTSKRCLFDQQGESVFVLDASKLRDTFKVDNKKRKTASGKVCAAPIQAETVLPAQKMKNVEITLKGIGFKSCDVNEILEFVDTLGDDCGSEHLKEVATLMKGLLLTVDERKLLARMDEAKLCECERFLKEFSGSPQIREKLSAVEVISTFAETFEFLADRHAVLKRVIMDITNSTYLHEVLRAAITLGNELNTGKPWGNATCVAPESLSLFASVRTQDQTSAIDYLVQWVADSKGQAYWSMFIASLSELTVHASKLSLADVIYDSDKLMRALHAIHSVEWESALFCENVASFLCHDPSVEKFKKRYKEFKGLHNKGQQALALFGWDDYKLEDCLSALVAFKADVVVSIRKLKLVNVFKKPSKDFFKKWAAGSVNIPITEGKFVTLTDLLIQPESPPCPQTSAASTPPSDRWLQLQQADVAWDADMW
eukprot:TRINITY_DN18265_c0_g1_i1.p1 TRINITY_DN18265_c0_g1~~TRINITY_DN18265_c0_g1_i1.p1  ORF type:complete len:539 (+),score=101.85 TRINITY_DN18265_c0_g1_i1:955-2571(+)